MFSMLNQISYPEERQSEVQVAPELQCIYSAVTLCDFAAMQELGTNTEKDWYK